MAKRPIYYDTETTGIKSSEDRIVEIAAYDPVQERTFEKLINPTIPIPKEATAIHGITDDMVQNAPSFSQIGQEFSAFCAGETVLIAHNNDGFDRHFLRAEYARHNLDLPPWEMVDSLKWARKYRPDLPRHSLQFLRQIYGIDENNAHRALDDVIVLHKVFSIMIDDLPMETVLKLLSEQTPITEMPFGKHRGKPLSQVPPNYIAWLKEQGALDKPGNEALKSAFEKCSK